MSLNFKFNRNKSWHNGFTLVELLVAISIMALLSLVVYASFGTAREQTRDKSRMAALKELQLAIETFKAQNGRYPAAGCGTASTSFAGPGPQTVSGLVTCDPGTGPYIAGLVPEYIDRLPTDPMFENQDNRGFYYRSDGVSYKLMIRNAAENLFITAYGNEYAACPKTGGAGQCSGSVPSSTYAVYSIGAEQW